MTTQEKSKEKQRSSIKVALIGNPNVGKSVIFNYLTGVYVDVSNYPGTTIDISKAQLNITETEIEKILAKLSLSLEEYKASSVQFEIIDTPGVYGVSSFNDEEKATRDYAINADMIINVVSALSLERDLFLTKQLCDMGKPMLLVINQIDEAELRKLKIDIDKISDALGINVLTSIAIKSQGLDFVKESIVYSFLNSSRAGLTNKNFTEIKVAKLNQDLETKLIPIMEQVLSRAEALMILEGDEFIAERNGLTIDTNNIQSKREELYQKRRELVNELCEESISKISFSKRDYLGRILLNPIFGSIAGITVLYTFLFQFLGVFIAGNVVGFTEGVIMGNYYEPAVRFLVSKALPISIAVDAGNILFSDPARAFGVFLAGDYGVLTLTVTYLLGLLLPLVLGFYFGLALLEDSGYLPRLAVLVDGVLSRLGMNGRAIVPLILGGGCVTMATITTRMLSTKKEKIITMALLGLTIPCSAQLGVIQGLLSNIGGVTPWLIWGGTLVFIFSLVGLLMNKFLAGDCGHFISDLPPMRIPRLNNIWKKAYTRTEVFMIEATPAFFIAAALVAALQVTGLLNLVISFSEPLVSELLLLPKETALSFILGMVRRDFGAFGLLDLAMTAPQLITACLVLTLFVPCIATVAVMVKEGNLKIALAIWLSSWFLAFAVGGILARVLLYLLP